MKNRLQLLEERYRLLIQQAHDAPREGVLNGRSATRTYAVRADEAMSVRMEIERIARVVPKTAVKK